jgi:hypothetical protein
MTLHFIEEKLTGHFVFEQKPQNLLRSTKDTRWTLCAPHTYRQ